MERMEHALILNILRRQLGPISWTRAFKQLADIRGVHLGKRGPKTLISDNPIANSDTVSELANEVGIPYKTAQRRLKLAADLVEHPDLAEAVDKRDMPAKTARRKAREREAEKRNAMVSPVPELPPSIDIHHCVDPTDAGGDELVKEFTRSDLTFS